MTTYSDSIQGTSDPSQTPQVEEFNSETETYVTADVHTEKSEPAADSSDPTAASRDTGTDTDRWDSEVLFPEMPEDEMSEDEMHELAELDRYYSEMSAGELLQEAEFESYWGNLPGLDTDEFWSRIATMSEDESHELFEVMSIMGIRRHR